MTGRPLPLSDEQTAPFWSSASDHVLTAARCAACSMLSLPPDVVCGHCATTDPGFEFVPVDGGGIVRSWTVVRQSFLPGFDDEVPFVLVDVELDEQREFRLIGRLLDGEASPPVLGERVEVAWEDLTPEVSIPAFRRPA